MMRGTNTHKDETREDNGSVQNTTKQNKKQISWGSAKFSASTHRIGGQPARQKRAITRPPDLLGGAKRSQVLGQRRRPMPWASPCCAAAWPGAPLSEAVRLLRSPVALAPPVLAGRARAALPPRTHRSTQPACPPAPLATASWRACRCSHASFARHKRPASSSARGCPCSSWGSRICRKPVVGAPVPVGTGMPSAGR